MITKEKRKSIRIPLLSESCTWTQYAKAYTIDIVSAIKDISSNGIFIKSNDFPKPQDIIMLTFDMPKDIGSFTLKGRVVRIKWSANKKDNEEKGFGVELIKESESITKIFEAYLIYLRNKQIIAVSKRIIDEFFGPGGAPIK